jgi:preprotein translocase subunit YajC
LAEALLAVVMAPRQGANGTFVFFLNMMAVVLIFYFLLIRPQRKERERQKQMIAAIGKGDEIVTSGGIIGTVIRAEEDRLIIKTGGETKVTIERSRVAHTVSPDGKGTAGRTDAAAK